MAGASIRAKGYIPKKEIDRIPLFLRMDALVTFAKLQRILTPVNPNGELPWMAGLRKKLAAKMQLYREEFAKQTN